MFGIHNKMITYTMFNIIPLDTFIRLNSYLEIQIIYAIICHDNMAQHFKFTIFKHVKQKQIPKIVCFVIDDCFLCALMHSNHNQEPISKLKSSLYEYHRLSHIRHNDSQIIIWLCRSTLTIIIIYRPSVCGLK